MSGSTRRKFILDSAGLSALACLPSSLAYGSRSKRVAIFGAGIAGLACAHELALAGYQVEIYEARDIPGGKARSFAVQDTGRAGRLDLPAEHGYRIYLGCYHNLFSLLERTPIGGGKTVFDNFVHVPFYTMGNVNGATYDFPLELLQETSVGDSWQNFVRAILLFFDGIVQANLVSIEEVLFFVHKLLIVAGSYEGRADIDFENQTWWDFIEADSRSKNFQDYMVYGMCKLLQAINPKVANARSIANCLMKCFRNTFSPPAGKRGLYVTNGPSSETFINPWVRHLQKLGVVFRFAHRLENLLGSSEHGKVMAAEIDSERGVAPIVADYYVSALPVDKFQAVAGKLPVTFASQNRLNLVSRLKVDNMNGIMLYFRENLTIKNFKLCYQSPWLISYQVKHLLWHGDFSNSYGDGVVKSHISVVISDWDRPNDKGKCAKECSREEIIDEILLQLRRHRGREAFNYERTDLAGYFFDPAIQFSANGSQVIGNDEPLYVNTKSDSKFRPDATLPAASNFFLAGSWVRTFMDLDTMESAAESGRRAARAVLQADRANFAKVPIYKQESFAFLKGLAAWDQLAFGRGEPHPLQDAENFLAMARKTSGLY